MTKAIKWFSLLFVPFIVSLCFADSGGVVVLNSGRAASYLQLAKAQPAGTVFNQNYIVPLIDTQQNLCLYIKPTNHWSVDNWSQDLVVIFQVYVSPDPKIGYVDVGGAPYSYAWYAPSGSYTSTVWKNDAQAITNDPHANRISRTAIDLTSAAQVVLVFSGTNLSSGWALRGNDTRLVDVYIFQSRNKSCGTQTVAYSDLSNVDKLATFIIGSDSAASPLADTDDQNDIFINLLGRSVTITEVLCKSDAVTPNISLKNAASTVKTT